MLAPENSDYPVFDITNKKCMYIWGVLTNTIRKYYAILYILTLIAYISYVICSFIFTYYHFIKYILSIIFLVLSILYIHNALEITYNIYQYI